MKWNKDFWYLKLKNHDSTDTDPDVKFPDNGCRNSTIICAVIIKNLDFTHGPVPMGYISEASDKDTDLAATKNGEICFPKSWYETLGKNQDYVGLPRRLSGKESSGNAGGTGDVGSIPGSGRFSRRRKWQPTPVFLPGYLIDRGAWQSIVYGVAKELDTTSWLNNGNKIVMVHLNRIQYQKCWEILCPNIPSLVMI